MTLKNEHELLHARNALLAWIDSQELDEADVIALFGLCLSEILASIPTKERDFVFAKFALALLEMGNVALSVQKD